MKRRRVFGVLLFAALTGAAQMPQGAVLHFSCEEFRNNGATLPNVAGSNHNGRVSGVRQAAAGRLGKGCEFTGKNSSLQVTNSPALSGRRVTVGLWLKTGKIDGEDRTLVDKQAAAGYALTLTGGNAGARQGRLCFTVCGHACLGDTNLADNAWHHAAATFDGETLRLYVDGQPQKQAAAWRGELPASGPDLVIGMNRSSPAPREKEVAFDGVLDEIVLFDRALSPEEIRSVLAATRPKFTRQQVERRLAELKELLERGLILQDFYDRKAKECEVE